MQINEGTVTCTNGLSLVQGDSTVDWSQVTVGNVFVCNGAVHTITEVDADDKRVYISPAWAGSTVTLAAYAIVRDFTSNLGLPLLNAGDLEAAAIFSRAMQSLDTLVSSTATGGDPSIVDVVVSKTDHGFCVGNVLTLSSGTWARAHSTSSTDALIVGVVSSVPDEDTFWVRTQGKVSSIVGLTLVPGSIYYLRETDALVGDDAVNLCDGDPADTGELVVPVLQADSTSSGFLLTMAASNTGVFGPDKNGLVPGPEDPDGTKVLSDEGEWVPNGAADGTILAQHLSGLATVDWTSFAARSTVGVHAHIMDLHSRVGAIENVVASAEYTRQVFTLRTNGELEIGYGSGYTWSVPAGVSKVYVTLISGHGTGTALSACNFLTKPFFRAAHYLRLCLDVSEVESLVFKLGPKFSYRDWATNKAVVEQVAGSTTVLATLFMPGDVNERYELSGLVTASDFGHFNAQSLINLYYPDSELSAITLASEISSRRWFGQYSYYVQSRLTFIYALTGAIVLEYGAGITMGVAGLGSNLD